MVSRTRRVYKCVISGDGLLFHDISLNKFLHGQSFLDVAAVTPSSVLSGVIN
jgi:hypothetical protein